MLESLPNISKVPFDIRAEVLARLIAQQFDLSTEQMLHVPAFFHQRRGRKDVAGISDDFSQRLEKSLVRIETSREGLYDTLPESIFLRPEEEFGDDVRKTKALTEQEDRARQFLLPFEQVFFWLRLENEQREHETENRLETWWSHLFTIREDSELNTENQEILTRMLPYLPDIIGNWTLTAQWLELLTGQQVRIVEKVPPRYELPVALQKRMGDGFLGQDFIIGDSFSDGIAALEIRLENMTAADLIDYLPAGNKRETFENELLTYLLPLETPYSVTLEARLADIPSFVFGSASDVLGYTTYLPEESAL